MFYYVAVPIVIEILRLRDRTPRWRALFFLSLVFAISAGCAVFGGPVRLIMFLSGILLYEAILSERVRAPSSTLGAVALIVGLLSVLLPVSGSAGAALKACILFAAFFVVCLACFRTQNGWLASAFSWSPIRWLGNMSYSYYLLHGLALKAAFLALRWVLPTSTGEPIFFFALLPIMFILTLFPTAGLFLFVERPYSLKPKRDSSASRNSCTSLTRDPDIAVQENAR